MPTTLAFICKMREKPSWKKPWEHTDQERLVAVSCSCGQGIQDSTQFLYCGDTRVTDLLDSILRSADTIIRMEVTKLQDGDKQPWSNSSKKRKKSSDDPVVTKNAWFRHEREMRNWMSSEPSRRLLMTLGLSDTDIVISVRRQLVSSTIPKWSELQNIWSVINSV
jgi:hypothetical protein